MEAGVNGKLVPLGVGRNLRLMLLSVVMKQQERSRKQFFEKPPERTRKNNEYAEDILALSWLLNKHSIEWDDLKQLVPAECHDFGRD